MDIKRSLLYKSVVVGVIVLFIGVAVQPSVATVQPEEEMIDVEPKDYLFQTIIDIANNPDVKNLLKQYKYDLLNGDIDRSVYRKIFFRNPRLLFNVLFTKPSMTQEYLNFAYNQGIEITNILGEDKALEMMKSIEVTNTELLEKLNDIILSYEELSVRITKLEEMNEEIKPDYSYPIICGSLILIFLTLSIIYDIFIGLFQILPESSILRILIVLPITMLEIISYPILILLIALCWEFEPW